MGKGQPLCQVTLKFNPENQCAEYSADWVGSSQ